MTPGPATPSALEPSLRALMLGVPESDQRAYAELLRELGGLGPQRAKRAGIAREFRRLAETALVERRWSD